MSCSLLVIGSTSQVWAQQDEEAATADGTAPAADDAEPAGEPANADAKVREKKTASTATAVVDSAADADEGPQALEEDYLEQGPSFARAKTANTLGWHGGLDLDLGYAGYSFEEDAMGREAARPMHFYDARGRFVVGPTVEYRFGEGKRWFLAARGELVAWVRESGRYQINADDVFAQIGQKGTWDVKVGRFRTWRVYHKSYGFDLYTLEDVGACRTSSATTGSCSLESGNFGPHTYEVNHIYDRDPIGRAALHVYPTRWSGLEVTGALGNDGTNNTIGGRGAGLIHFPFLRVSAAGEYRMVRPAQTKTDSMSNECSDCGVSKFSGFGGGAELTFSPVFVGVNAAQSHEKYYTVTSGSPDSDASNKRTSLGGYAEVDAGSLLLKRELRVGFGLNRTEVVDDVDNFEQHYQMAGYVVFPLGFNNAGIKLVVSRATLDINQARGAGISEAQPQSTMTAGRVRFSYPF